MKLLAHANRSMPFSEHGTFCSPAVRGAPGKGHPDRTIINKFKTHVKKNKFKTLPLKNKFKTP